MRARVQHACARRVPLEISTPPPTRAFAIHTSFVTAHNIHSRTVIIACAARCAAPPLPVTRSAAPPSPAAACHGGSRLARRRPRGRGHGGQDWSRTRLAPSPRLDARSPCPSVSRPAKRVQVMFVPAVGRHPSAPRHPDGAGGD